MNYTTQNIVYIIKCNIDRCKQTYIGESDRSFKKRISEHLGYMWSQKYNQATGYHFNQPGHIIYNIKVTILEKLKSRETNYRGNI